MDIDKDCWVGYPVADDMAENGQGWRLDLNLGVTRQRPHGPRTRHPAQCHVFWCLLMERQSESGQQFRGTPHTLGPGPQVKPVSTSLTLWLDSPPLVSTRFLNQVRAVAHHPRNSPCVVLYSMLWRRGMASRRRGRGVFPNTPTQISVSCVAASRFYPYLGPSARDFGCVCLVSCARVTACVTDPPVSPWWLLSSTGSFVSGAQL